MRNLVGHALILGIVSSLTAATEYSGSSSSGGSNNDGYGKSGLDSSYNSRYVGEYAGQLSGGKALGELHNYGESQIAPEQGSHYDEGESDFGDTYGQQGDGGNKYSSNQYDGYSHNLELSKFPVDVEAHHYTGEDLSDAGLAEENHEEEQQQQQYESHNEYQSNDDNDDDGERSGKQHSLAYNPYEQPEKGSSYNEYNDGNRMLIVPYSGYEEAEQNGEQPSHYSGYENSQQTYNQAYEEPKAPSQSYESPGSSYSSSHEAPKVPSPTYASYYKSVIAPSSAPTNDYSLSKPAIYGSHEDKYQQSPPLVTDSPSKTLNIVQKISSPGLKNFHTSLQKNIMTIDHGHGSFSYSSLYRS